MPGLGADMAGFNNDAMLMAAAQMLQASGPSRQPQGLGAILGGGMATYMGAAEQARQRKMEEDQAKQIAELRALQVRDLEGTLGDKASARANAQRLSALKAGFNPQGQQAPAEIALGSVPMNSSMGQPQPQSAPQNEYLRRMAYANYLRSNGAQDEGDAAAKEALDFMPKVKEWSKVRDGDKVKYAPLFDNGTMGEPVDREIAEKLEFRDAGGSVVGLDAYTGKTASTIRKTATIADGLASQRLGLDREKFTFDKTKEAKPQFNAEAGGFITPPSKANPNGGVTPLAGFARPLTEAQGKASTFALRMTEANKKLAALEEEGVSNSGGIKRVAESTGNLLGLGTDSLGGALSNTLGAATNWTQSPKQQQYEQLKRDWINSNLRLESGAAIGKSEFESADKQYFPQVNDDEATIREKAINRENAARGVIMQAGPGAARLGLDSKRPSGGGWSIKRKD